MSKINDPHEPEYHRKSEAQHRVEGAIDEPERQLAEDDGDGKTEDFSHADSAGYKGSVLRKHRDLGFAPGHLGHPTSARAGMRP